MSTVTLSSDFKIRIPDEVREVLGLAAGDELQVVTLPGRVELVPIRPHPADQNVRDYIRAHRGILRGMDTTIEDDQDRL